MGLFCSRKKQERKLKEWHDKHAAFMKTRKVIASCKTERQLNAARQMRDLFVSYFDDDLMRGVLYDDVLEQSKKLIILYKI